jgi:hypothetical protein
VGRVRAVGAAALPALHSPPLLSFSHRNTLDSVYWYGTPIMTTQRP